ncbi:MAG TPA: hypothetical protein VHR64_10890 [Thermomicrobiales bacterium]|jgi:hypothetical protein|nr:hypothetical protein [Thermomicrobiales bacterium]
MIDREDSISPDEFEDVPVAEDDVRSAARSCSAILVIIAIVGAIACIMLGIALVYG